MYGVDGRKFQRQYKHSISNFKDWEQKPQFCIPKTSHQLSIDEVTLSDGELHTVLTSKKTKGRKGSIIAIIKGTKSDTVIEYLLKINGKLRSNVRGITLDMAGSMKLRISHRWEAIEQENHLLMQAKEKKRKTIPRLNFLKMAIRESNFWQEAGIYFIKAEKNGLHHKINELKSYSRSILI